MKPYYQLSGEEVLREVNGSEEPLTKEQVKEVFGELRYMGDFYCIFLVCNKGLYFCTPDQL